MVLVLKPTMVHQHMPTQESTWYLSGKYSSALFRVIAIWACRFPGQRSCVPRLQIQQNDHASPIWLKRRVRNTRSKDDNCSYHKFVQLIQTLDTKRYTPRKCLQQSHTKSRPWTRISFGYLGSPWTPHSRPTAASWPCPQNMLHAAEFDSRRQILVGMRWSWSQACSWSLWWRPFQ